MYIIYIHVHVHKYFALHRVLKLPWSELFALDFFHFPVPSAISEEELALHRYGSNVIELLDRCFDIQRLIELFGKWRWWSFKQQVTQCRFEKKRRPMFSSTTFNKFVNVLYWSKRKWIYLPMSSPCRLRYDLVAPKFFTASNSHWNDWKKSRPKVLLLGGVTVCEKWSFFSQGSASRHAEKLGKWCKLRSILLHFHPSQLSEFSMKLLEAWWDNPLVLPAHERHFPSNIWSSSVCGGCFFLYFKRKLLAGCKTFVHSGLNNIIILWRKPY